MTKRASVVDVVPVNSSSIKTGELNTKNFEHSHIETKHNQLKVSRVHRYNRRVYRRGFMKSSQQKLIYWIIMIALVYLGYRYWGAAEQMIVTVFNAAKPFFAGAMIAYIVNILMDGYETLFVRFVKNQRILKMKRGISLALAYTTFAVAIIIILGIVIPELIRAIQSILSIDPTAIRQMFDSLEDNQLVKQILSLFQGDTSGNVDIASTITNYVQKILNTLGNVLLGVLTSATSVFSTLMSVLMSIIFSIYVLMSKEKLARQFTNFLRAYVPSIYRALESTLDVFNHAFRGFFVSQTVEAVILGTLCFVGMSLIRLPFASTISILVGSLSLIPLIGAFIGALVGVLLILTQNFMQALIFIAFIIILQQFESNLIYPKVVGESIGLPPMWVLVSIAIGGALGNILGMFVAVPVAAACYRLLRRDLHRRLAAKEELVKEDN